MRTGPSTNYKSQELLVQDAEVELLDEKQNSWVKVRYNGIVGYVSSDHLRPFKITGITLSNENEGTILTELDEDLHSDSMRYLGIYCKIETFQTCMPTLKVRLIGPNGQSWSNDGEKYLGGDGEKITVDKDGRYRLFGWGNADKSNYPPGQYHIEIFYKSDEYCIASKDFYIYK